MSQSGDEQHSQGAGENPFARLVKRYLSEEGPVLFVQEVLGIDPDDWQKDVLRAVGRGERGVSVRSAHGVGKSCCASWAMIWALLTHFTVKVVVTAPTGPQLYDALFAEVKRWVRELPGGWADLIEVKSSKIELVQAPNECFISARTSRAEAPEAMQGVHADYVLLVADEASGIPEAVFEAAIGSMSGENATTMLLGNPTRGGGFFFNSHHSSAEGWYGTKVSAYDSPRVSQEFIDSVAREYGADSNAFRVRVLGEFPTADDDTVIPRSAVEAAMSRDIDTMPFWSRVWGLDCARFGDDKTVLTKMQGRVLAEPQTAWAKLSTMEVVGRVKREWDILEPSKRPEAINVDVIGLGAGVVDRLRELGLPAYGINVSEAPALAGEYKNLRSELWFKGRDWFMDGSTAIPTEGCEQLVEELTSVAYDVVDSNGKISVEAKSKTKKRLRRSPDHADSFLLCMASDAISAGPTGGSADWSKPIRRNLPMP